MVRLPLTAEEFERWTLARDAYVSLANHLGDMRVAASQLLSRLASGLISAYAETQVIEGGRSPPERSNIEFILPEIWKTLANIQYPHTLELWKISDAEISLRDSTTIGQYGYPERFLKLYGIRFDPIAFAKLVPRLQARPQREPPEDAGSGKAIEDAISKEPPVSEAHSADKPTVSQDHVRQWAELYVKLFSETEDTGDKAWDSAKGFFQGKSVPRQWARDAVAAIRPRKAGRKPTAK